MSSLQAHLKLIERMRKSRFFFSKICSEKNCLRHILFQAKQLLCHPSSRKIFGANISYSIRHEQYRLKLLKELCRKMLYKFYTNEILSVSMIIITYFSYILSIYLIIKNTFTHFIELKDTACAKKSGQNADRICTDFI
jgi:hypothetical protein